MREALRTFKYCQLFAYPPIVCRNSLHFYRIYKSLLRPAARQTHYSEKCSHAHRAIPIQKRRASSMLWKPLLQLCFISSCGSTAISFEQDELCFHVLFCYHKSSESGKTAIVSCKNCHNFITERFLLSFIFILV